MRRAWLLTTFGLVLTYEACGEPSAFSDEVAAVEAFYERIIQAQEELSAQSELDWDDAIEKWNVFDEWIDWREAEAEGENPFSIPNYPNETIVFVHACIEWFKSDTSKSARFRFRSAPAASNFEVLVALPNGQGLELQVSHNEKGWGIEQIDPSFSAPLLRKASIEQFTLSFVKRLLEVESSLPAMFITEDPSDVPFLYYSNRQHTRLVSSTRDAPLENLEPGWSPYWSQAIQWVSAQHRAWRHGWETELGILGVIHGGDQAEADVILRFRQDGETVDRPAVVKFYLSKEEGGWSIDRYEDWRREGIFEFRRDGKGSWNYEAPKKF